jgi:hypothetical protein
MDTIIKGMPACEKQGHGNQVQQVKMKDIIKEGHPAKDSNEPGESRVYISNPCQKEQGRSDGDAHE